MGCYGIGITRVVASAIEQNHDDNGIIWPMALAPFHIAIVPINYHKSDDVKAKCDELHDALSNAGFEVLLMDAEKARLGGMLADVELIGVPHRIVVGDRGLEKGEIEYRHRAASENEALNADNVIDALTQKLSR
jgi:prolyl-tRNA synthetase